MSRSVFAIALCLIAAPTAFAQTRSDDSVRVAVDRVFAQWNRTDSPGCALGVSRGGKMIYEKGYGMSNLEDDIAIDPSSIFHVASVSKQFTAMATMLLAHEGKLALDDDIRKYLPELPSYGHTITVRHLLTHTSGLRDQWDLLYFARGRFDEDRITEADVLDIVSRQKGVNFVPGAEYLYSNTGFTLLGTIVKRVSGKSLRDFADERIFKPLGMMRTHFHDDYTMVVKGRTSAYVRTDGVWHVSIPNFDTYGATSLYTTVGDLLKWEANFEHPIVGDAALLRAMQTSAVLTNGDSTGYGFGIATEIYRGARFVEHGGADAGYRSFVGRFPEHDLAIAVACNTVVNTAAVAHSVADVYLGSVLEPKPPGVSAQSKPSASELAAKAGVYVNSITHAPTWIAVRDGNLAIGRTAGPPLIPLSSSRFRVAEAPVEFEFKPNGDLVQTSLGWPARHPVTLVRNTEVTPSRAELERYAGKYYSEELDATYTVTATDTSLELRTRMGGPKTETPAYKDAFVGDFLLEFARDSKGAITGMSMSSGRVRRVRFVRR
ncbi:MAG: serine hydrolase [Gemmatimonadota bacterium]|nr:serine hydrolase [Gemmatimonadota bacterium]